MISQRVFSSILIFCLGACAAQQPQEISNLPHPSIPTRVALEDSRALLEELLPSPRFRELSDSREQQRASAIFDKILVAAQYPPQSFPVYVFEAGEVKNALSVLGNTIVVFQRTVESLTDAELAFVLAHEFGHILMCDDDLDSTQHSHSESLVDTTGLMLMSRAGFDPDAALSVWDKLDAASPFLDAQASGSESHPAARIRRKLLEGSLPEARAEFKATLSADTLF